MTAFVNEPLLELRRAWVRDQARAALADLDVRLPLRVPMIVDGEERAGTPFASTDPGRPATVVAEAQGAVAADVDAAVAVARERGGGWAAIAPAERAEVLVCAAAVLRRRRLELAALAVRECAKPWAEADADVCEAIDFLEYYARGAVALGDAEQPIQLPGEHNTMRYVARGVAAVIAPWNFPLAILTGMTAAALAVGNAVVVKPAEQAPACAKAVVDALLEAGVPAPALHLLPGGDEPGKALVAHPDVHVIAFTGSGAAGLQIIERAAKVAPGQRHVKRVVAEMGGKNCVIVDADADLDDAVPAIVRSAFGFAGQKCSAASVVLGHAAIAAELRTRLAGAIATLSVGPAEDFATDVPPVIDAESQERVRAAIATGQASGTLAATVPDVPGVGHYVAPSLVADLPAGSPLVEEEIFGPVLALVEVASIEEALEHVERSRFALTGGLFSRSPGVVAEVARRSPVGNLYVNREITGAMVGRQPFGGNRLSGIGAKTGGPDYLLQFAEVRVVTENTVRHGLVV